LEPVGTRNVCGHGLCDTCWTDFVSFTIRNSSSPEVQKGNDDSGGALVLDIKCPADREGKCLCPVEFSVLKKALPISIENLVRTVMRSMSRLFLSGAAAIAQCVCGAVACSSLINSEVECTCGHVQCIGDMKRGAARASYIPHPLLSSDEVQLWQEMNTVGSEKRSMVMRYKNCPKCGTMTTKCGCTGRAVCSGMDKCPNEACEPSHNYSLFHRSPFSGDHMKCSKCGTDWCWICRRIGSTEQRCSRPASERKDTKELLLRISPEVQALEKALAEMGPKSLFDHLQLKNGEAGVTSSLLNRTVMSISGAAVFSIEDCRLALRISGTQCVVIETADLSASCIPSSWTQMDHNGRKFFYNTETQLRQWECPRQVVPLDQRKVQVICASGYESGSCSLNQTSPPTSH
jgi:hypothetical protein